MTDMLIVSKCIKGFDFVPCYNSMRINRHPQAEYNETCIEINRQVWKQVNVSAF
jgi:hypothetical protein